MTTQRRAVIAFVDVDYRAHETVTARVMAGSWTAAEPTSEHVTCSAGAAAEYEPGQFFRRELPYVVAVIEALADRPDVVVVDGYAWLAEGAPGLGAHLHEALGGSTPVVGVAKRAFASASAVEVFRGQSKRPLYVTAAGTSAAEAAAHVRAMHGAHRLPTLLKRVDRLCRDYAG